MLSLDNVADNTITLGRTELNRTFTETSKEANEEILKRIESIPDFNTVLAQAGRNATNLIKKATHGHVVVEPNEILVMDTNDKTTAKRIWRLNQGGIGFSKDGYEGDFPVAMTQDGAIVADFITAGKMNDRLEQFGLLYSMKKVMVGDRLFKRVKDTDFIVFDGMSKALESRLANWDKYLDIAYRKGYELFSKHQSEKSFSLDDRYFIAVKNSESGEVSDQTVFAYHQKDDVIWAEYSGGSIMKGFLIGKTDVKHHLHFTYQHVNTNGELKSGYCDSVPNIENGILRFYESWRWSSGEEGTSVIEEI